MADSSFVSRVVKALGITLLSVVIFVVTRMPPKRGQNYTPRTIQQCHLTDLVVQPHPSRLQPVQSSCRNLQMLPGPTPQLTLLAEVLAMLTNSISAAVSEALLTIAQPRPPAAMQQPQHSSCPSFNGSSPGGTVCCGSHFNFKCRGGDQRFKCCRSKPHHSQC